MKWMRLFTHRMWLFTWHIVLAHSSIQMFPTILWHLQCTVVNIPSRGQKEDKKSFWHHCCVPRVPLIPLMCNFQKIIIMIILVCASSCCVSVKSVSAKLDLKKQFIWKSVVVWKYERANNIENTIFKSLTGDRTAVLCGHLSHVKVKPFARQRQSLHFSVILRPWILVPLESKP